MLEDINCELTPLTNGRGRRGKGALNGSGGRYGYYLDFVRRLWLEISTLFWKFVIFLLLLIIMNTILRSIFVKETSLMFTSSVKGQGGGLSVEHYALSQEERAPHLFWIVTDSELTANTKYLHQLSRQGIVFENYHISEQPTSASVNRVSALISKYAHRLTADDVDGGGEGLDIDGDHSYFEAFDASGYGVETLSHFELSSFKEAVDAVAADTDSPPVLMYIVLDDAASMRSVDAEIGRIVSYLQRRESLEVWQNALLIVSSDSAPFAMLCGPRIPNKQRGIKSQTLFDVTDWQRTLLHFSGHSETEDIDGFDLWDSIIYGAESPRTEVPTQTLSNVEVVTRDAVIT